MIRRILQEKNFVAYVLAAITGIVLYFRYPFPEENFFLELIFLWARPVFQGLKVSYTIFLYTTPYIVYSDLNVLYFRYPFPEENFFLELIFLWARPVFQGLKVSYTIFLYTTPYIVYSILLSAIYIFTLQP